MEKKKILFLITKSNFGGAQRYVYDIATNLSPEKYDVVVAFGGHGVLGKKLLAAGIRTITIKNFQRDISIGKELRSFVELWQLYKKEQPDIIHLNSPKAGGSGAFIARLCGIKKIIYTTHGWAFLEPRSFVWKALVWCFSYLTTLLTHDVIIVSAYEKKHTHMPFVKKKMHVIHTAIPHIDFLSKQVARNNLFNPTTQQLHAKNLWLVTNAELNHNKNLFTAIDAVVTANKQNEQKIFYTIISDGELREELEIYIKEKNAEKYVILLGYIENARTYLHNFDIFLLPSKKEGLPYAVLEAGAAGLPVIASRVGGIPEIIEDSKTGLLIDPHDRSTITAALETLVQESNLRKEFGLALQHKVQTQFTLAQMLQKTIVVYEKS